MKKLWGLVKIKVLLGYFCLIVIVSFTTWIIYSEILQLSKNKTNIPSLNEKVMYINKVLTNLYRMEGLERSYLQTGKPAHYRNYILLMDIIFLQLDTLSIMSDDPIQLRHTDSIHNLLDKKKKNLRELVAIRKTGSSEDLYQRAMMKLTYSKDTIDHFMHVYKTVIANHDSSYIKQKKKNFLARLVYAFSPQENQDSSLQINISHSVTTDSILNSYTPTDSVDHFLSAIMADIRDESIKFERQLAAKEQDVLANNRTITLQLRQILSNFEKDEFLRSLQDLNVFHDRIRQTTWLFVALGTAALITIIVFLVLILKDISKSQQYRLELEQAKAYSYSLLKSKEQIMLSITHDIKSPLGSIIGFARLMNKSNDKRKNNNYLAHINNATEHILKLINDLVDFTRLETGKLKTKHIRFNLKTLIDETVSGFYPIALSQNLKLRMEYEALETEDYRSDPVRIKQVLVNLISNALKFTNHGEVVLNVSCIESFNNTDRIRFEVSDTGIGISEKDKKLIFNEFSRVSYEDNRQYEGAGLGLAICKRIVSLLGGTIDLKSKAGEGSQFTIKLPLERCSDSLPGNSVKVMSPVSKLEEKRVLLIDDDKTFLNMTAEILQKSGTEIYKCTSPEQALKELERNTFDLIITDIQMPTMTGIELLEHVQDKIDQDMPIIAITGKEPGRHENLLKVGFDSYLYKPFLPEELLANINTVLAGEQSAGTKGKNNKRQETSRVSDYSLNQIKQFAMGDSRSVKQILTSFIETSNNNIRLFPDYLNERKYGALSELAHKMLTMFRQLEAANVIAPLSKIEQADNKNLHHSQWEEMCDDALSHIKELISTISEEQDIG